MVPESPPRCRGVTLRFSACPAAAELARAARTVLAEFPGSSAMLGGSNGFTGPTRRRAEADSNWKLVGNAGYCERAQRVSHEPVSDELGVMPVNW